MDYLLSIPFIGIFALHLPEVYAVRINELFSFQFPLLGFLLCIAVNWTGVRSVRYNFQFPLLGFLLCIDECNIQQLIDELDFQFPLLGFLLCI